MRRTCRYALVTAVALGAVPAVPALPVQASPDPRPDFGPKSVDEPVDARAAAPPPPAAAGQRGRYLQELWAELEVLLDQASEARRPPLVPPTPVTVRWGARRVASLALDAPLLALGAADLDGDRQDELLALTATELVVIGQEGGRLRARARMPLPAEPALVRPRDPVGALAVQDADGDGRAEVAVRSSEHTRGALIAWRDGALVALGPIDDFPLCAGVRGRLAPGRNYFEHLAAPAEPADVAPGAAPNAPDAPLDTPSFEPPLPERFFSARCGRGLVDTAGRPLDVAGAVATDGTLRLEARARCRSGDQGCPPPRTTSHARAGTAMAIADIDRDGQPEIAIAQAAAPGDPDGVLVLSWAGEELASVFERRFSGGVAGLAAGDLDGDDALELVGAVRLLGSNRVDLWLFSN